MGDGFAPKLLVEVEHGRVDRVLQYARDPVRANPFQQAEESRVIFRLGGGGDDGDAPDDDVPPGMDIFDVEQRDAGSR